MRPIRLLAMVVLGVVTSALSVAHGAATLVDWSTAAAISTGTLGGNSTSLANLTAGTGGVLQIDLTNLSGAPFSFQPGGTASEVIEHGNGNDWTVTFNQPVSNLLVYAVSWRTTAGVTSGTTSYEFDQAFSLAPGSTGGSASITNGATPLANDTLVLTGIASDFFNGILIFPGPVTTLSLDSSEPTVGRAVGVTFGVPEPSASLGAALLGGVVALRRKRS